MFTFKKKHTSEHPLPDLRPDLESQANFGLEQTFKIFKNLQKHIPASGVDQGHSSSTKFSSRGRTAFGKEEPAVLDIRTWY